MKKESTNTMNFQTHISEPENIKPKLQPMEAEAVPTSPLDDLRAEGSFERATKTADYIGRLSVYAEQLTEEVLPSGEADISSYLHEFDRSEDRVVKQSDRKSLEVRGAKRRAEVSVLVPVAVINDVVEKFEKQLDTARLESSTIHDRFSTDITSMRLKMDSISQEHGQLVLEIASIRDSVLSEVEISNQHIARLAELNNQLREIEAKRAELMSEVGVINKKMNAMTRSKNLNSGPSSDDNQASLKESRASRRKLNTSITKCGEDIAGLENDIDEVSDELVACGKRSNKLQAEGQSLQSAAEALVLKAGEIVAQLENAEKSTMTSIGKIAVANVPDIINNQAIMTATINNNASAVLSSLRRSNPDALGQEAAKNKVATRRVIETTETENIVATVSADPARLQGVLTGLVDKDEARQHDNDVLRHVMYKNGMPMPEGVDTMHLLQDFYNKRPIPRSLSGGRLRKKEV